MYPFIEIKPTTNKGLGVFATEHIVKNTLIEVSPVIVLNETDTKRIHKTHLHDYYFAWGEDQKQSAIALGYVSIYNHQVNANCIYETFFEDKIIKIISRLDIKKGQELTINYNHDPLSDKKTWFDIL